MKPVSYGVIPYMFTDYGIKILLMQSSFNSPTFDYIKGKRENNESCAECCIREVQEEIGITIPEIKLEQMVKQENRKKDICLFFVNWDSLMTQKLVLSTREVYKVKWFYLDAMPLLSKNQRLIETYIHERFNKVNFYHKLKL